MRSRSISALVIILALGLVLLVGYTATRRNAPFTNQPPLQQQAQYYKGNLMGTNPPGVTPKNVVTVDKQKSDNIRRQLSKMGEISQVGVIVSGNTALVGYSPSKKAKDINATKNLIANKVKKIDPSITNVVVSESADIMARINKLTSDIKNNRPGNEIGNEVNQLLQRVAPVVK